MTSILRRSVIAIWVSAAFAVLSAQSQQTRTDEYTRYELLSPETSIDTALLS